MHLPVASETPTTLSELLCRPDNSPCSDPYPTPTPTPIFTLRMRLKHQSAQNAARTVIISNTSYYAPQCNWVCLIPMLRGYDCFLCKLLQDSHSVKGHTRHRT